MPYKNITISGLPGGGSTTLLQMLKENLGWQGYSGGEFMRAYAIEQGYFSKDNMVHHDATVYPDDFDRQVDYAVRHKLQHESNHIFEAWLSGFLAQGVPDVLKVLVYCSDESVRIDRVVNRDSVSVDEAKQHIRGRETKNRAKWINMYTPEWREWVVKPGIKPADAEIDFWNPDLYDITIDTFRYSREETLQTVLNALKK